VPEGVAASEPEITFDRTRLPTRRGTPRSRSNPGEHRLVVTAPGRPRWEIAVRPPSQDPSASRRRSTAFWIVLGAGGVSLATSVVTGVLALNANAYVKDNCSSERSYPA